MNIVKATDGGDLEWSTEDCELLTPVIVFPGSGHLVICTFIYVPQIIFGFYFEFVSFFFFNWEVACGTDGIL